MQLSESSFIRYAMSTYDNPQCYDVEEFEDDLKRFLYVRKLLRKYDTLGDLNERLILNHLTIIYNCFGANATPMLFMKLEGLHEYLKPFVEHLYYLPEIVRYNGKVIYTAQIDSDYRIATRLRRM